MTSPAATPSLPRDLVANPRLSRWVQVGPDGTVTVRVGKVELGQGIATALAQIAADELDVDLARVRMAATGTSDSPDEGVTSGSLSVTDSGAALAHACAHVRAAFLDEAVRRRGLDAGKATVSRGEIGDARGTRTTYAALARHVDLDRDADGSALPKSSPLLRVVGTSVPRLDLPDKITGRPRFVHDMDLPGQAFGRVVRPPSPAATLADLDTDAVQAMPGVLTVVRDGSFVGVVAETEYAADRAATTAREQARWKEEPTLPDENDLRSFLRGAPAESSVVENTAADPDRSSVARTLRASYSRPYLAHASMAPSAAVARWDGEQLSVWTHSQGVFRLRGAIAAVLGVEESTVTVRHVEGAGCYGHNGADDVAFDAVLLARALPGRPVLVRWTRADELSWAPFGSAMDVEVEAGVDGNGDVVTWSYDVWSQGHTGRPGAGTHPNLLAAAHLSEPVPIPPADDPPLTGGAGTARNAVPLYDFPARRVQAHRVLHAPLRTSALRSLGAFMNVFAIESFVDELAAAAGRDPVDYRRAHLSDPRARDVLDEATRRAGWGSGDLADGVGRGVAVARYKNRSGYCAVVAEVEAVREVRVRHLTLAVDVGRVITPDGVRNQVEGGAVQATSWATKERVRFDRTRVTSVDWETYPILGFDEFPGVDVHLLDRPDEPSLGAGEIAHGPTAAAIGNALAAALGVRVRDLPLDTAHVVAAMED